MTVDWESLAVKGRDYERRRILRIIRKALRDGYMPGRPTDDHVRVYPGAEPILLALIEAIKRG